MVLRWSSGVMHIWK